MIRSFLTAGTALLALASAMPAQAEGPAPARTARAEGAKPIRIQPIAFSEWQLANGLRVIAIPDASTADVTTSVWYEVGAKHDPEGRAGFAHLFEHILSRKTENMPYNTINGLVEDVGGTRNASTSPDRTNYYETVPAQYLDALLWTHAERMARPVVDKEVFENERGVVKEELRQRVLAPPYGRLVRIVLPEVSFDRMPQRRPSIGSIEQLDSAQLDDARAFHQAYYGPDTATLIVAGNFDLQRLRGMVDQHFGGIARRANPVSLTIAARDDQRTSPRRVDVAAPNVPLPVVGYVWRTPGAAHKDTAALEMIEAILGRGRSSRMQSALIRPGKASDVAVFNQVSEEVGSFASLAFIGAGQDIDAVAKDLAAEIDRLRSARVSPAELAEARNELMAAALRERETARGRSFELGEALVLTGDSRAADRRLAALNRITAADLQRAARTWLSGQSATELRYTKGEYKEAAFANPVPMPRFVTVPPPTGAPAQLKPEAERQKPPATIAVPPVIIAQPVEGKLANGMPIISATTGTVPVATMAILFPGGTGADAAGKSGVGAMAADLLDNGTKSLSAAQIGAAFEKLGVNYSAAAGGDGAMFTINGPVANLPEAGRLLVELLRGADYPEGELATERKRNIDGIMAGRADPGGLASMALAPLMFGDAPYGRQSTPASLGRITRDDLLAHRTQWYHPGAARIVVAGGIQPAAAKALAEATFGAWQSAAPVPVAGAGRAGTGSPSPRTVVIDMPAAGQAAVVIASPGLDRKNPAFYEMQIANAVLGAGSNGRLFQEIRTKRALSYGAYSNLSAYSQGGLLSASAQTKNESAAEVVKVMLGEFARLGQESVAAEDLAKRAVFLNGNMQRSLETSTGYTNSLAALLQNGMPASAIAEGAAARSAVTPDQARAIAARIADPARATVVVVGNAAQFLEPLRALRGEVTVIKAADFDPDSPTLGAN